MDEYARLVAMFASLSDNSCNFGPPTFIVTVSFGLPVACRFGMCFSPKLVVLVNVLLIGLLIKMLNDAGTVVWLSCCGVIPHQITQGPTWPVSDVSEKITKNTSMCSKDTKIF